MNFGDKLKQLRNDKRLTQPDLAAAMGIEQSYLSKLENGKSLPSNDVLNRILDVFGLDIGDLVDDLDQGARNQLREIPDVASHFNQQKQELIGNRRRWLLLSSLLLAFGAAFIYAGYVHLLFSDTIYQYQSDGVVLDGEPKELFRSPRRFVPEASDRQATIQFLDSIKARVDEDYRLQNEFHGNIYNVAVEGGSRTYFLTGRTKIDPWQSKLIAILGVIMAAFGLIGIFLERKLARYPG